MFLSNDSSSFGSGQFSIVRFLNYGIEGLEPGGKEE